MTSYPSEAVDDVFDVPGHQAGIRQASSHESRHRDERLLAIGEMTAKFAHQVRTPLTAALLYAGQLDTSTPRQARVAARIVGGLSELRRMVDDMLGFAAGARVGHTTFTILKLLQDVKDSIAGQLSEKSSVRISVTDPVLSVSAHELALKGAVLNLLSNADQASAEGARILLHAQKVGDRVHICVTDDGPGIADDVRLKLFNPFFTTRENGTGLGLAVVKAVATVHGGDVSVATSDLGSTFSLCIPALNMPGDST